MGLVGSKTAKDGEYDKDKVIKEKIEERNYRVKKQRVIKLLLYGPGECGKTTILRRMMKNHGNSLHDQKNKYRPNICYNVIEGAYMTLKAAKVRFSIDFEAEGKEFKVHPILTGGKPLVHTMTRQDKRSAEIIIHASRYFIRDLANCNLNPLQEVFTEESPLVDGEAPHGPAIVASIRYFYETSEVFNAVLSKRNIYGLFNNWTYFAEKLKKYPAWGGPNWNPSDEDLLMSRMRTTGLNEFIFSLGKVKYRLIDIGGQRAERRKFFFLFAQIDCMIFVSSLSDYDETLFEDPKERRLKETLRVWGKTANSPDFATTWIILFFNKFDRFQEKFFYEKRKLPRLGYPIKPPLPPTDEEVKEDSEVETSPNCPKAMEWFENLFMDQVDENRRPYIRPYVTSAMTTDDKSKVSLTRVMPLVVDFMLNKIIESAM